MASSCDRRLILGSPSPSPPPPTSPASGSRARASGSRTSCASRSTTTCSASASPTTSARQKGDLLTRVTEDVNDMGELFSDTLGEMLQSALLALGMTVVLLFIDPVLALLSLIDRAAARRHQLLLPPQGPRPRPHAAPPRGRPGDHRQRGAVRDDRREGLRRRGAESERVRSRSEQRMGVGVEVARLQARFDGTVGVLRALRHRARHRLRRLPRRQGRAQPPAS